MTDGAVQCFVHVPTLAQAPVQGKQNPRLTSRCTSFNVRSQWTETNAINTNQVSRRGCGCAIPVAHSLAAAAAGLRDSMKTMTAKYPGVCKRTGQPIRVGDTINYFGKGHAELVSCDDETPHGDEDEYREGNFPPSRATLENDRRLAKRGLSVIRFSSGAVMTQNSKGRCEDAPCCGCCT